MRCGKRDLLLYAVTDRGWLRGQTLSQQVEEALKAGVTFLQLREKDMDGERLLWEAAAIRDLCRRYQVPFAVNDNVEIARRADADGAHVGQGDMEVKDARRLLGPDKILGVSVQTPKQALEAQRQGADYLGVGAVFPTGSKADAQAVTRETLQAICEAVRIPVVAIGGINAKNVGELAGSGISGVAVISAIWGAKDIPKAVGELKSRTRWALGVRNEGCDWAEGGDV